MSGEFQGGSFTSVWVKMPDICKVLFSVLDGDFTTFFKKHLRCTYGFNTSTLIYQLRVALVRKPRNSFMQIFQKSQKTDLVMFCGKNVMALIIIRGSNEFVIKKLYFPVIKGVMGFTFYARSYVV